MCVGSQGKACGVFVSQHASPDVEKMILGNKCDANDKRQVSREQGEKVSAVASPPRSAGWKQPSVSVLGRCFQVELSSVPQAVVAAPCPALVKAGSVGRVCVRSVLATCQATAWRFPERKEGKVCWSWALRKCLSLAESY